MVPLMALVYWPTEAVIISCLLPVITGCIASPGTLQYVRWRHIIPVLFAAALLTPVGSYFLITGNPEPIRRLMGLIVLLVATLLLFGVEYKGARNTKRSITVGALGGLIQGYLGMAGAWFGLYFLSGTDSSNIQRANLFMVMMFLSALAVIPHVVADTMLRDTWIRGIALVLPYGLGILFGTRLFFSIPDQSYRRIAVWLIFFTGLSATFL